MAEIQSNISHKVWDPTDSYRQFQSLTFNTDIARKFFHLCSICKNAKRKKKKLLKGRKVFNIRRYSQIQLIITKFEFPWQLWCFEWSAQARKRIIMRNNPTKLSPLFLYSWQLDVNYQKLMYAWHIFTLWTFKSSSKAFLCITLPFWTSMWLGTQWDCGIFLLFDKAYLTDVAIKYKATQVEKNLWSVIESLWKIVISSS